MNPFPQWHAIRSRYALLAAVTLIIVLCLGWSVSRYLVNNARDKLQYESNSQAGALSSHLLDKLEETEHSVMVMAGTPLVAPALLTGGAEDIGRANLVLDRYREALDATVCYLVDIRGITIASSNRDATYSYVGKNYSFRPYFTQSLLGQPGRYFALGVTSGERGYYASYPVRDGYQNIIGVAVIKRKIESVESSFRQHPYCFCVDPHGIVFFSSQPDLLFTSLWPLDEAAQQVLIDSRQFGSGPFKTLGLPEAADGAELALEGQHFYVNRKFINPEGWSVVLFTPTYEINAAWLLGLFITFSLSVLIILFFLGMYRFAEYTARISASEENCRSIFNGVNVAIFVHELFSGKIIDVNKKMCEMYGYTREEVLSAQMDMVAAGIPPYTTEEAYQLIRKASFGEPQLFEWLSKDITGRFFWSEVNLKRTLIGGKECILAVVRDITQRKQAEEALKESEDKYRTIFETTGTATLILEEDMKISLANMEVEKLSGYSKEELEGKKSWTEFIAKDDLEMMKEYHRLRRIDPNSAPRNYEFRLIDRQGDVKDILLTVDMIPGTKKSVSSFLDITERKRAEQALQEQSLFLQRLIDTIPNPIFYKDIKGLYQGCNKAFEAHIGLTKEEIVGKSVYDIYPKDLADKYYEMDSALFGEPGVQAYEYSILYADGNRHDVIFNKATYSNTDGSVAGLVGVLSDITERKRAEEALAAERLRFETLTEHAPFGMGLIDREGICKYINPKFIEIFGYNLDDVPNKEEWFRKAYPNAEYRQKVISTLKDDLGNILPGEQTSRTFTVTCKDGKEKIIRFTPVMLQTGEYLITFEDITQGKQMEKELLRIRKAIESTGNAVIMTDKKGFNVLYHNDSLVNLLGYTVEELNAAGGATKIYSNPDTAREVYKTLISGHSWKGELELLTRDNRIIPVYLHGDAVKDETREIVGLFGIYTDLTEHKMAEERLRSVNQKLLDILEFLPDATFVIDRDKKVITWNRAIEEITGLRKEEILGKDCYAYAVPFYGEPRPTLIDLIFAEDRGFELKYEYFERKENTIYAEGFTPSLFNGEGAYLWGKASPLFDNEGNIIGAIESIHDITERKRAEEKLRLSEERCFKIFNASPGMLTITTLADGYFIDVNERFLHAMGYCREEIIGHTSTEISIWVNPERAEMIKILHDKGMVDNLECILRKKSGEVYTGLYSAEIVCFDGEQFILSVVNDITERKRLEEEMARLERLNLVGEMAAGIGHEIRNPMTTVRGFLQLLGGKKECIQFREYYDLMIEELDRANSIITEFLSLAKNKKVSKRVQNLNPIVGALLPLIQADATRAEKYVKATLEETPDLLLDEKEIRQLILNLVRNGLEAMSPGGYITIRTFKDGNNVVLAVQDQGKGIEPDIMEKIGTPFFTTKDFGTGLGLAVCYSIAARHNAAIKVETGLTGTTFYIKFELQKSTAVA